MPSYMENKTVLLTGSSGGIGQPLASALAAEGASLVFVGRDKQKLQTQCDQLPGTHRIIVADLSRSEGIQQFQMEINTFKKLDIIINCIGVNDFNLYEEQDYSLIHNMIQTNLLGPMFVCRAALPLLRLQSHATILNIGSTFGSIGYPGYAAYSASKFGLRGFTEALRRELLDSDITVHYLSPRAVKTPMNSESVDSLNAMLGNSVDDPQTVVDAALHQLQREIGYDQYLGWPEKLFVRLNALMPKVVSQSIAKHLPTIYSYFPSAIR
ncbi:SDR family oxidoreductase [Aurantivibrio plasticivorans]